MVVPEVSFSGGILKGEGSLDLDTGTSQLILSHNDIENIKNPLASVRLFPCLCLSSGVGLSSRSGVLLRTSFRSRVLKSFLSKVSFMMFWLISVSRSLLSL